MDNKKIAITGAGSGLGRSLAIEVANRGAEVYLLGRTKEKLKKVANTIDSNTHVYSVDISNKAKVNKVFSKINPLDILINNAGVGSFDQAENLSKSEINKMIDINLKGTIFCTQAVLPAMKENNSGLVVNIISTAGKTGKKTESVYCASKFGVRGFTESLALELEGSPLKAMGVYMGGMKTSFWDGKLPEDKLNKFMDPDDIAEIILDNLKSRPHLNVEELVIQNEK